MNIDYRLPPDLRGQYDLIQKKKKSLNLGPNMVIANKGYQVKGVGITINWTAGPHIRSQVQLAHTTLLFL